ncbi:MAG: hypothetical protein P4L51_06370 [Puia sp.]|nr:hypothetical protein [Puia sp.]
MFDKTLRDLIENAGEEIPVLSYWEKISLREKIMAAIRSDLPKNTRPSASKSPAAQVNKPPLARRPDETNPSQPFAPIHANAANPGNANKPSKKHIK